MEASFYSYLSSINAITDLVGTRLYPHHLPQPTTQAAHVYPVLTFQTISVNHDHTLDAAAGVAQARIQVDCWSRNPAGALTLAETVRQQLHGFMGNMRGTEVFYVMLDNEMSLDEPPADA